MINYKTIFIIILTVILGFLTVISPISGCIVSALIACQLLFFARPILGFYVVFLMSFLQNINLVFQSPLRIITERYPLVFIPVLMMIVVSFAKIVNEQRYINNKSTDSSNALLLFFLFWTSISTVWTLDPYHAINTVFKLLLGLTIYFMVRYFIADKAELEKCFNIIIYWSLFLISLLLLSKLATTGIIQYQLLNNLSIDIELILSWGTRAGGFAPPHMASDVLILVIFIGVALYPGAKNIKKIFLYFLGLFILFAMIQTGTRSTAMALIISMTFFLITYSNVRKYIFLSIPLFYISFIVVIIFNAVAFKADRLVTSTGQSSLSMVTRFEIWDVGFEMLKTRILGAGAGGFARLVDPWPGAHGYYFCALFDLGVVGLGLIMTFLVYLSYRIVLAIFYTHDEDMKRYLYCLGSFMIVFYIHGIINLRYDNIFLWTIFGMTRVATDIVLSETSKNHNLGT